MGKWPSIPFLHRGFDVSRSMLGRLQTHMVVAMVLCMFGGRWLVATSHTVIYIVDIFYECVFPAAGSHEDPHMQPLEWSTYQSRLNWPGGQGRVQKGSAWPRRWWCDLVRRPQIEKCNKFTGSGVHIHFYIIDQAVIQVERSGPLPVEQYIYIILYIYVDNQCPFRAVQTGHAADGSVAVPVPRQLSSSELLLGQQPGGNSLWETFTFW